MSPIQQGTIISVTSLNNEQDIQCDNFWSRFHFNQNLPPIKNETSEHKLEIRKTFKRLISQAGVFNWNLQAIRNLGCKFLRAFL